MLQPLALVGAGASGQLDPGAQGQRRIDDLDRMDPQPTRLGMVMAFGGRQKLHELGKGLQHGLAVAFDLGLGEPRLALDGGQQRRGGAVLDQRLESTNRDLLGRSGCLCRRQRRR